VPLSEHEQRMLEQMERALYAEDPKFATALEGSELRRYTRKRVYQATAGFLVGVALLMAGVVAPQIWVSVVGFLVMLGCAVFAVTSWRKAPKKGEQGQNGGSGQRGGQGSGSQSRRQARQPRQSRQSRPRRSMMERIEERWQRRRDEGQ
jgi:hypothetical protein